MARASTIALCSVLVGGACTYRPCADGPTPLIGPLQSHATPAQAKAILRPTYWAVESERPGPTDGRPPFNFTTIDAGDLVDLEHAGQLKLIFYNGRLSQARFTPKDPDSYFAAIQRLPGASLLEGRIVSLGSNTRVWRVGASSNGPIIEWYDDCLRADQDSWIKHYS